MKKKYPLNGESLFHYVFYTEFGYCAIRFQDAPFRLKETILPVQEKALLSIRIPSTSTEMDHPPDAIQTVRMFITDYFLGASSPFPFEKLLLDDLTPLQQAVLKAVHEIPFGETRSYGEVAELVRRQKASRFVGTTMAGNPFPLLIPCHRVIKSTGHCGMFGGGSDLKMRLLHHESGFRSTNG